MIIFQKTQKNLKKYTRVGKKIEIFCHWLCSSCGNEFDVALVVKRYCNFICSNTIGSDFRHHGMKDSEGGIGTLVQFVWTNWFETGK